jgi:hypothetical protein
MSMVITSPGATGPTSTEPEKITSPQRRLGRKACAVDGGRRTRRTTSIGRLDETAPYM